MKEASLMIPSSIKKRELVHKGINERINEQESDK